MKVHENGGRRVPVTMVAGRLFASVLKENERFENSRKLCVFVRSRWKGREGGSSAVNSRCLDEEKYRTRFHDSPDFRKLKAVSVGMLTMFPSLANPVRLTGLLIP